MAINQEDLALFQSPRSGKFVSDPQIKELCMMIDPDKCFNPLDRGNLYQMVCILQPILMVIIKPCFNPLDRGNLYQMDEKQHRFSTAEEVFQSPRSGKFVSDKSRKL